MRKQQLHPLPLRIWHWGNALIILFLLVTGFLFRVPGIAALSPHDISSSFHRWAGIAMIASWVFWFLWGLGSGHLRRQYAFLKTDATGLLRQANYYLFAIFRGENNPFLASPAAKFNPLQKLAYSSIMGLFSPLMLITGLLFMNMRFLAAGGTLSWDAVKTIDSLHVTGFYIFACFLVIHVYMATLGPTPFTHIKGMILGYEEEPEGTDVSAETEAESNKATLTQE